MDRLERIGRLSAAPGVTGLEEGVAAEVLRQLQGLGIRAWQDKAGSVFGQVGEEGPLVLLMAHMDEIGMAIQAVEENGMARLWKVAGVDPRVLAGSRLLIHTKDGPLPAVAGALPPHLQRGEEAPRAYAWEDLLLDTGLGPAAKERVQVGDVVTLYPHAPLALLDGRLSCKTLDDRGPLGALLDLLARLRQNPAPCRAVLCASVQEEKTGAGGLTAPRQLRPDMAIAVDVCHSGPPETEFRTHPLDTIVINRSLCLHPGVVNLLEAAAKKAGVEYEIGAGMTASGTDAFHIAPQAGGIATGLLEVPLRYMHTSAEVISARALDDLERVLEAFLRGLAGESWKEALCWKD